MSAITVGQAVVLGAVEGVTEFLPVSSTGHLKIVEGLTGVPVDDDAVIGFSALVQVGAIAAVLVDPRPVLPVLLPLRRHPVHRLVPGLDRVAATRLSFFLGIPALTGAGLYESKDALGAGAGAAPPAVGTLVSFVVAYASVAWLLRFVARHSFDAFVIHRIAVGVLLFGLLGAGLPHG